jgi:hypothetical protein
MVDTNMPAAGSGGNIRELIAEYRAAVEGDDDASDDRLVAAERALFRARPTAVAHLAAQVRWPAAELGEAGNIGETASPSVTDILEHVADQFEAIAGRAGR